MPMADALSTTPRRSLLAGIIAVPFLATTAHAEAYLHADAALLTAFGQFQDCRKRIDAHCMATNHVFGTPEGQLHEDKLNTLVIEQDELVAAMAVLPATTQDGQQRLFARPAWLGSMRPQTGAYPRFCVLLLAGLWAWHP